MCLPWSHIGGAGDKLHASRTPYPHPALEAPSRCLLQPRHSEPPSSLQLVSFMVLSDYSETFWIIPGSCLPAWTDVCMPTPGTPRVA